MYTNEIAEIERERDNILCVHNSLCTHVLVDYAVACGFALLLLLLRIQSFICVQLKVSGHMCTCAYMLWWCLNIKKVLVGQN